MRISDFAVGVPLGSEVDENVRILVDCQVLVEHL